VTFRKGVVHLERRGESECAEMTLIAEKRKWPASCNATTFEGSDQL
jgi:hypothetical protein